MSNSANAIAANKLRRSTEDRIATLAFTRRTGRCIICKDAPIVQTENGGHTATCLAEACLIAYIFFGKLQVTDILDDGEMDLSGGG